MHFLHYIYHFIARDNELVSSNGKWMHIGKKNAYYEKLFPWGSHRNLL